MSAAKRRKSNTSAVRETASKRGSASRESSVLSAHINMTDSKDNGDAPSMSATAQQKGQTPTKKNRRMSTLSKSAKAVVSEPKVEVAENEKPAEPREIIPLSEFIFPIIGMPEGQDRRLRLKHPERYPHLAHLFGGPLPLFDGGYAENWEPRRSKKAVDGDGRIEMPSSTAAFRIEDLNAQPRRRGRPPKQKLLNSDLFTTEIKIEPEDEDPMEYGGMPSTSSFSSGTETPSERQPAAAAESSAPSRTTVTSRDPTVTSTVTLKSSPSTVPSSSATVPLKVTVSEKPSSTSKTSSPVSDKQRTKKMKRSEPALAIPDVKRQAMPVLEPNSPPLEPYIADVAVKQQNKPDEVPMEIEEEEQQQRSRVRFSPTVTSVSNDQLSVELVEVAKRRRGRPRRERSTSPQPGSSRSIQQHSGANISNVDDDHSLDERNFLVALVKLSHGLSDEERATLYALVWSFAEAKVDEIKRARSSHDLRHSQSDRTCTSGTGSSVGKTGSEKLESGSGGVKTGSSFVGTGSGSIKTESAAGNAGVVKTETASESSAGGFGNAFNRPVDGTANFTSAIKGVAGPAVRTSGGGGQQSRNGSSELPDVRLPVTTVVGDTVTHKSYRSVKVSQTIHVKTKTEVMTSEGRRQGIAPEVAVSIGQRQDRDVSRGNGGSGAGIQSRGKLPDVKESGFCGQERIVGVNEPGPQGQARRNIPEVTVSGGQPRQGQSIAPGNVGCGPRGHTSGYIQSVGSSGLGARGTPSGVKDSGVRGASQGVKPKSRNSVIAEDAGGLSTSGRSTVINSSVFKRPLPADPGVEAKRIRFTLTAPTQDGNAVEILS